jgi:predicted AlkP superfamily phosphohydrolase/phosphomutase
MEITLGDRIRQGIGKFRKKLAHQLAPTGGEAAKPGRDAERAEDVDLSWMPASSYALWWPEMDAFAIPSFYDGRIRINLTGRERDGRVSIEDYDRFCDALTAELRELAEPVSGLPVVREVMRQPADGALSLDDTKPDIQIIWEPRVILAFQSAALGMIGPAPVRRTGGHTGGNGIFYMANGPLAAGLLGTRSAFDVAPTIAALMGVDAPAISGASLLAQSPASRGAG